MRGHAGRISTTIAPNADRTTGAYILRSSTVVLRIVCYFIFAASFLSQRCEADEIRELQTAAVEQGKADWGHWGTDPEKYSAWINHSNRLTPVYTFGISLDSVRGEASVYRSPEKLSALYGTVPAGTLNPQADYFDQTDVYRLQQMAIDAGKKYIVLVIFDGMDWQTTWATSIYKSGRVSYRKGRGSGLSFQDYRGVETDYGYFVSSPHNSGTGKDVNAQVVTSPGGTTRGGYDASKGGEAPWSIPANPDYLLGKDRQRPHAYTDSASSATSMTAGIKTYNAAINIDPDGNQVIPLPRRLQQERGWSVGVVTSVPISHATPACAYANNVSRSDYQDLTRDLVGLPSIAHRESPLPGVDILLGCGWGETSRLSLSQGTNFVAGNKYITKGDLAKVDVKNGGRYEVVQRTANQRGNEILRQAAERAVKHPRRLFGFFGASGGNLPYQTADGKYDPTADVKGTQRYSQADVAENPTLAEMTRAALQVLETNEKGFWLMVEPGDVDWANHRNNIDTSIGAVLSGDAAFTEVTRWVEANDRWDETAVIVTADHGHFFVLREPARLLGK